MYDDLALVLTCEISERLTAIRALLDSPARPRGSVAAVTQALRDALDSIAENLGADIFPALRRGNIDDAEGSRLARRLKDLSEAVRAVHRRLGHLSLRWSYSGPDIVTRKLREDGAAVVTPAICPSDEYDCIEDDVRSQLAAALRQRSVTMRDSSDRPIIVLPRSEGANPLAWVRLLGPLARQIVIERGLLEHLRPSADADDDPLRRAACLIQARLGGPAVYAAEAAHSLFMGSVPAETLASLGSLVQEDAAGLTLQASQHRLFDGDLVAFYGRLVREHAALLGHAPPRPVAPTVLGDFVDLDRVAPPAALPAGEAAGVLFAKLDDGVPINALGAEPSSTFAEDLAACTDAIGLYRVLGQVAERPASVAAILTMGWLHKAQRDYTLFGELVRAAPRGVEGTARVLTQYGHHVTARGLLLQQSLEAAHVHQIFAKWGGRAR